MLYPFHSVWEESLLLVHHSWFYELGLYANATAFFDKWFSTDDSPATEYNNIALIIYHTIITMEFLDKQTYQEFKETKASAGVCFLFICVGGNGSSSSNKATFSEMVMWLTRWCDVTYKFRISSLDIYYIGSKILSILILAWPCLGRSLWLLWQEGFVSALI